MLVVERGYRETDRGLSELKGFCFQEEMTNHLSIVNQAMQTPSSGYILCLMSDMTWEHDNSY